MSKLHNILQLINDKLLTIEDALELLAQNQQFQTEENYLESKNLLIRLRELELDLENDSDNKQLQAEKVELQTKLKYLADNVDKKTDLADYFKKQLRLQSRRFYNAFNATTKLYKRHLEERKYHNRKCQKFEGKYYYSGENIKQIAINLKSGHLNIRQAEVKQVSVKLQAEVYLDTEEWDDAEDYFFKESVIDVLDGVLKLEIPSKYIHSTLEVIVPQHLYKNVVINIQNGNVLVDNFGFDYLFVQNNNGFIKFNNLTGKFIEFKGNNTAIDFKNVIIEILEGQTGNGQIIGKGAIKTLNLDTNNGMIKVENSSLAVKNIKLQAINGNIELAIKPKLNFQINAQVKTGSIEHDISLDNIMIDNNFEVAHKLVATIGKQQYANLELITKNGNIKLQRKLNNEETTLSSDE